MFCLFVHSFIFWSFLHFKYLYHIPPTSSVKPTKAYSRGSVVMVDEIMNASPSKFRFPEAGLRVMVTSHFGPKTRLRMASRLIITEVLLPVVAPIRWFSCCRYILSFFWVSVLFSEVSQALQRPLISLAQSTHVCHSSLQKHKKYGGSAEVRIAACAFMCSLT